MQQWNSYKETMNHEMVNVTTVLSSAGYKIDEGKRGIKFNIGFDAFKAVDYIANNKTLDLIEFTDIYLQKQAIQNEFNAIKKLHAISSQTKRQLGAKIQKELIDKYKDSISIITEMQNQNFCQKLHDQYGDQSICTNFIIVIAPFHRQVTPIDQVKLSRFITDLKSNLTRYFPDKWNVRVQILSISEFSKLVKA